MLVEEVLCAHGHREGRWTLKAVVGDLLSNNNNRRLIPHPWTTHLNGPLHVSELCSKLHENTTCSEDSDIGGGYDDGRGNYGYRVGYDNGDIYIDVGDYDDGGGDYGYGVGYDDGGIYIDVGVGYDNGVGYDDDGSGDVGYHIGLDGGD